MWIYIEYLKKQYGLTEEEAKKVYEIMVREKLFKRVELS